jgi:hypothetical protein
MRILPELSHAAEDTVEEGRMIVPDGPAGCLASVQSATWCSGRLVDAPDREQLAMTEPEKRCCDSPDLMVRVCDAIGIRWLEARLPTSLGLPRPMWELRQ